MSGTYGWAEILYKQSIHKPKKNKNPRFRCVSNDCNHTTTKNQSKKNGAVCFFCGSKLDVNPTSGGYQ